MRSSQVQSGVREYFDKPKRKEGTRPGGRTKGSIRAVPDVPNAVLVGFQELSCWNLQNINEAIP